MHLLKHAMVLLLGMLAVSLISFGAGKEELIIRKGEIALEVEHVEEAIHSIRALVQEETGSVSHFTIDDGPGDLKGGSIVFHVPTDRLDALFEQIRKLGRVASAKNTLEDVGQELASLDVKLENTRMLERRFLDILKTNAQNVRDVLEVERELARVREQLEQLEARKRRLQEAGALSTVEVKIKPTAITMASEPKKAVVSKIKPMALKTYTRPMTRPPVDTGKPPANGRSYSVQVAAFKQQALAEATVNKLVARGYEVYIDPPFNDNPYYRVKIGKFKNQTEAAEAVQKIKQEGFQAMIKTE
jgi:cell division septation protein DedD